MSIDLISNAKEISKLTVFSTSELVDSDRARRTQSHFAWLHRQICQEKMPFKSAAKARQFNVDYQSRTPRCDRRQFTKTEPYHCPVCGLWHLTNKDK